MNINEAFKKSRRAELYDILSQFIEKHEATKRSLSLAMGKSKTHLESILCKSYYLQHGDFSLENFKSIKAFLVELDQFIESYFRQNPYDCIDDAIDAYIKSPKKPRILAFSKDEVIQLVKEKLHCKSAFWDGDVLKIENR